MIKTLTKDCIALDLTFESFGEHGRVVPVERVPLERYLLRVRTNTKSTQSNNNNGGSMWSSSWGGSSSRDATPSDVTHAETFFRTKF